ncbi:hypothetical protein LMH73_019290 [Vibrio splendidus]|nr:hypothetical protein [Vibrio splendidus]MCC4883018.1 hypothetical protein [Vibrio splendidus]
MDKKMVLFGKSNVMQFNGLNAFTHKPIQRTKQSHPYSYEPFETFNNGRKSSSSVWSDRIRQQNPKKFNKSCNEVWGNDGHDFDTRQPDEIERFLQVLFDNNDIKLNCIVETCDHSSGISLWHFSFSC